MSSVKASRSRIVGVYGRTRRIVAGIDACGVRHGIERCEADCGDGCEEEFHWQRLYHNAESANKSLVRAALSARVTH